MSGKIKEVSQDKNYTAINIGEFGSLLDYAESKGKVFLKDEIKATGAELSFQLLPAGTVLPFSHSHIQNEEVYIVIKGKGQFQVDGKIFDISEGSVVRVAPAGERSLKSSDDSEMIYMVIQVKENSLQQWSMKDGKLGEKAPEWQ